MGERRGAYRVLVGKVSDKTKTVREVYYIASVKNWMARINLAQERVNVGISSFIRSRLRNCGSNSVGTIAQGK
jgi:hypothetical protein